VLVLLDTVEALVNERLVNYTSFIFNNDTGTLIDLSQELNDLFLHLRVRRVGVLKHLPDNLNSLKFIGRDMHSELVLIILSLAASANCIATGRAHTSGGHVSAHVHIVGIGGVVARSDDSIGLLLFLLFYSYIIVNLVDRTPVFVHQQEHLCDAYEAIVVHSVDYFRTLDHLLLEELGHSLRFDPDSLLSKDLLEPSEELFPVLVETISDEEVLLELVELLSLNLNFSISSLLNEV